MEELSLRLEALEKENKILKQKNLRLEKDMKNAKIISRERDILAKKMKREKEKKLEYFNIFLKYCGEIIIAVDRDKQLIYSSEIYKKTLEVDESIDLESKDLYSIFKGFAGSEKAERLIELCDEVLISGKEKHEYFHVIKKNGEHEHIILNISPAKGEDGEIKQLVIVFNDVTEIYEMKEMAEKAAKAKTSFLANTSHEIRTPMNAILGMTELILRDDISDTVKENAYNIKSAGNNLLGIINDILDISKIESGKFNIIEDEYEVGSIINDVTNIANVRIDEKDIKFLVKINPDIPYRMYGDEVRLRQIIINLVNNAIKFTEEGYVKLEIKEEARNLNKILLKVSVEDTGIGIKEENIDKLFESFQQVDIEKNKKIEGTGLGLAICKSLLDLMGGNIKITSTYGVGSKFEFIIPQRIVNGTPFVEIPLKYSNQNILVCESEKEYLNELREEFNDLKIVANFVNSKEMLKEMIMKKSYDHIFITTDMIDVLKEGKNKFIKSNTQITIMTGSRESYKLIEGAKVVQKPVYCLPIATILNNENLENIYNFNEKDRINEFIAPKAKILIVDDNMVNLKVAKGLMKDYKMQIDLANSGFEVIEMIDKGYDIVFMDHMMPGIDGIETTKRIRSMEDGRYKELTIIALTANAVTGAKEMFLENGIDDFLSKPIEIKKLNNILKEWIPDYLKEEAEGEKIEELKDKKVESIKGVKKEIIKEVSGEIIIDGINNKEILENIFTEDEYIELLETFLLEGNRKIKEIIGFYKSDIERYVIEVHGVKSSAKSIGAETLSKSAMRLEDKGRASDFKYIRENNSFFIEEYRNILDRIGNCLKEREGFKRKDNSEVEALSSEKFKDLLKEIIEHLENFESDGAEEKLKEVLNTKLEEGLEKSLKEALSAISSYEYDEAIETIERLF